MFFCFFLGGGGFGDDYFLSPLFYSLEIDNKDLSGVWRWYIYIESGRIGRAKCENTVRWSCGYSKYIMEFFIMAKSVHLLLELLTRRSIFWNLG